MSSQRDRRDVGPRSDEVAGLQTGATERNLPLESLPLEIAAQIPLQPAMAGVVHTLVALAIGAGRSLLVALAMGAVRKLLLPALVIAVGIQLQELHRRLGRAHHSLALLVVAVVVPSLEVGQDSRHKCYCRSH